MTTTRHSQPHVHLETTPIERIDQTASSPTDGKKTEIDTLVLATGFNLWDANFPAIEVIGRDGRNLGKWWRDNRFQAYEGVAIPYFPNFVCAQQPLLLQRAVVLHDDRVADAAHGPALREMQQARRHDVRGQPGGATTSSSTG